MFDGGEKRFLSANAILQDLSPRVSPRVSLTRLERNLHISLGHYSQTRIYTNRRKLFAQLIDDESKNRPVQPRIQSRAYLNPDHFGKAVHLTRNKLSIFGIKITSFVAPQ